MQNHPADQEPRRVLGSFFAPKSQNTPTWEQRKLGELSRSFEYGLNAAAKEYDGQNKYLRITDIDDTSRQFVSADITSPDANLAEADNYRLSDGDVLFARTGASVGKTYLYKKSDGLVYFAGFLIRAKIKESVSAGFIFQNTLTRSYERYIAITSQRSGQPGVNAQEYAEYQLMLPELFEQEKIAKLLEAFDTLITLHQRKYEKLVNIKKSMLDKMFPKNGASVPEIRFKGFTDLWEQRKLGDAFERVVRKNTNNESRLPLTISAQDGLVDQITYFNNRVASRDVSNYYLVYNGEFAYNKSTSDGYPFGAVKRLDWYEKGVLSTLYIVFALKHPEKDDSDFMTVFYDTDRWHRGVAERAAEGARNHGLLNISADDFFDIDTTMPEDKAEQEKIGRLLKKLDTLITLHQREHIKPILEVKRVKRNE